MANQLDLEEQEQLDQIKHFWKQYGNAITWVLILVLGAFASWNFYQYWQRSQATQAAALFDEFERSLQTGDKTKVERVFTDIKEKFGSSAYAQQAGLLVAKHWVSQNQLELAKSSLLWVAEKSSDKGLQALAKLRLSAVLMEEKKLDEALAQLSGEFPADFEALVADRKGDLFVLKGDTAQAIAQFQKAYAALDARTDYRRLVEVKLNSLGVDVVKTASSSTSAGN
jgi:predicted negative regulator of RcsB-dependent stress response